MDRTRKLPVLGLRQESPLLGGAFDDVDVAPRPRSCATTWFLKPWSTADGECVDAVSPELLDEIYADKALMTHVPESS
ncbi:hypothetical protein [Streptomyces hyaluromycini]|uniref:hypothetical protein n=1 Tax=Streptomyces hyaluromycini TaxID=1377993 RepID=UPI000B5CCDB9|nr:hypothetical protein [Streptomyces hyaluromycini]